VHDGMSHKSAFCRIWKCAHQSSARLQASVCAGLPVIATLKHLRETGDKIISVEGIFSNTISYVFNTLSDGVPFSRAVADTVAKGFAEADPRDDLSGIDVARKVRLCPW
jgi:homoserine dehydrogenase